MKAAVYEQFGQPITIQDVPDPVPTDDGVVLRVEASGICRSDWHAWLGHDADVSLPHVPGHEIAGVVEAVGKHVAHWTPGDRVTVPFCIGCGTCPQCQAGDHHVCDNYFQPGFTHWGSFAQYVAIRYADINLVRLPEGLDSVTAASLGCRFVTSFRAVIVQGRVTAGNWVAVHGCGGVGLSAIMIADAVGGRVIGVDIDHEKLRLARSVGATETLNARDDDQLIEKIHQITGGGAHVSIDALGSVETARNSILSLRKRGKHIQVGLLAGDESDAPLPMDKVIGRELEVIGSHGMQAWRYGDVMAMIAAGRLDPGRLVSRRVSLGEAPAVLEGMSDFRGVGVTVIDRFEMF